MRELFWQIVESINLLFIGLVMIAGLWSLYAACVASTWPDAVMWFGVSGGLGAIADREIARVKKHAESRD